MTTEASRDIHLLERIAVRGRGEVLPLEMQSLSELIRTKGDGINEFIEAAGDSPWQIRTFSRDSNVKQGHVLGSPHSAIAGH